MSKATLKKPARRKAPQLKPSPPEAEFYQVLIVNKDDAIRVALKCVPKAEADAFCRRHNFTTSILEGWAYARPIAISWRYLDEAEDTEARYSRDRYEVIVVDGSMNDPHVTQVTNATLEECEAAVRTFNALHAGPWSIYQCVVVPMMANGHSQFDGCDQHD